MTLQVISYVVAAWCFGVAAGLRWERVARRRVTERSHSTDSGLDEHGCYRSVTEARRALKDPF